MKNLKDLVRPNILSLVPFSSARSEYQGQGGVLLDANENPYNYPDDIHYNRYPDPFHKKLRKRIAEYKNIRSEQIIIGNGSDECITMLVQAFCRPGIDNILIMPPTFTMFKVCASINDNQVIEHPLDSDFEFNPEEVLKATNDNTKLLFVCSPNNPSGNVFAHQKVEYLLNNFEGLVVVDEAYIDFYGEDKSFVNKLDKHENLVVLQTFSKAWGLAALRLGVAYTNDFLIQIMARIKPPYNVTEYSLEQGIKALDNTERKEKAVAEIIKERNLLFDELNNCALVNKVFPSETNFLLVSFKSAEKVFDYLLQQGVVIRNLSRIKQIPGCLRISVGTPKENEILMKALNHLANE